MHPDPQSFDNLAFPYERYAQLTGGPLRDHLTTLLADGGGRAVDLGCGAGRHAELLADRYTEVLAVDLSGPMLAHARRTRAHPRITYAQRDLTQVEPDRDGTFDLVFSAYALHHVPDLGAALERIRGLVAPGGQAILVDNTAHPDLVSPDGRMPRGYYLEEAAAAFARDLADPDRPHKEALERLGARLHPGWLEHLMTDRLLTPDQWAALMHQVFPGADTVLGRTHIRHYRDSCQPTVVGPDRDADHAGAP